MSELVPPLVGLQEIQKMLGNVSKQYIHQLIAEKKIIPVQTLACGRIFLKKEIEEFVDSRKKKTSK